MGSRHRAGREPNELSTTVRVNFSSLSIVNQGIANLSRAISLETILEKFDKGSVVFQQKWHRGYVSAGLLRGG